MTMSDSVPKFRRGVKFRFDNVRSTWVLLAPEKLFMPDEIAAEILKLVDGERSIRSISGELADRFGAPPDVVLADVTTVLQNLSARGALEL